MRILDAVALIVLAVLLPVPIFWLLIHPAIKFWRKVGKRTYLIAPALWLAIAAAVFVFRDTLVEWRLNVNAIVRALGLLSIASDVAMWRSIAKHFGWRTLVGLPELMPQSYQSTLVVSGVYAHVRHPRYIGIVLALLGMGLLTGLVSVLTGAALSFALFYVVTFFEEAELSERYGEAYSQYQRRVPRMIPRMSSLLGRRKD